MTPTEPVETIASRRPLIRAAATAVSVAVALTALVSCTSSSGSKEGAAADTAPTTELPRPATAATVPLPTDPTTSTSTTTTSTTTTTLYPPTTIAHGAGPIVTNIDGVAVKSEVASTARAVYDAAIAHDYSRLAALIGDNRFRWGFVGERKPTDAWKAQFDAGKGDELARIASLLDSSPGIDSRGNTVWPYVALKDPSLWNADDEVVLTRLGFNPENIKDTQAKGRYVDYKLVIDPTGRWTTFGVGY
jgi:hypothetical protein